MYLKFNPEVASVAGVNAAVLFDYVAEKCTKDGKIEHSFRQYREKFNFFTNRQIQVALQALVDYQLLSKERISTQAAANVNCYVLTDVGKAYYSDTYDSVKNGVKLSAAHQGKLISVPKKTVVNAQKKEKANKFIYDCNYAVKSKFNFTKNVVESLSEFFIFLANTGTFLTQRSIVAQLQALSSLNERHQLIAVKETVAHGWKSLTYLINDIKASPGKYADNRTDAVKNTDVVFDGEQEAF